MALPLWCVLLCYCRVSQGIRGGRGASRPVLLAPLPAWSCPFVIVGSPGAETLQHLQAPSIGGSRSRIYTLGAGARLPRHREHPHGPASPALPGDPRCLPQKGLCCPGAPHLHPGVGARLGRVLLTPPISPCPLRWRCWMPLPTPRMKVGVWGGSAGPKRSGGTGTWQRGSEPGQVCP